MVSHIQHAIKCTHRHVHDFWTGLIERSHCNKVSCYYMIIYWPLLNQRGGGICGNGWVVQSNMVSGPCLSKELCAASNGTALLMPFCTVASQFQDHSGRKLWSRFHCHLVRTILSPWSACSSPEEGWHKSERWALRSIMKSPRIVVALNPSYAHM